MGWIVFVAAYIPLMVGVYHLAERYGRDGAGWTFGSLFISPIVCIVILLCLGETTEKSEKRIRQQQASMEKNSSQKTITHVTDELKKIKELLDSGVISQEEFEKLKIRLMISIDNPIEACEENNVDNTDKKFLIMSHIVELKTGKHFNIIEIDDKNGVYICASGGGNPQSFTEHEIELFSIWRKRANG
jgi:uncharacterized membrane protein